MWWTRIVFVAPGRRRRRAGDDDHEVVRAAHAAVEQRRVDLAHHVVGGLHRPHQVRLGAPQQRHLPLHLLDRREHQQPLRGCSRDSRRAVSPVWVNATSATAPSASPMSLAALTIAPPEVRGLCCSPRTWCPLASTERMIRLIVATACTGYLPDARLAGQHHRVGAVDHRIRHVGRLGPGRARVA